MADPRFRPIVVLTSNSEKNLPEAFLRRCVYYHIEFPDDEALKRIVARRFKGRLSISGPLVQEAVAHFNAIRELDLKKKTSTTEFLAWLNILASLGVEHLGPEQRENIKNHYRKRGMTTIEIARWLSTSNSRRQVLLQKRGVRIEIENRFQLITKKV